MFRRSWLPVLAGHSMLRVELQTIPLKPEDWTRVAHSNSPQDGVLQLQPKRRRGCRFSRFCRLDKSGTSAEFNGSWIHMNSLESVPIKIDGFPRIVPWFSQGFPMDFALNQFCLEKRSFRWRYLLTWTWIRPKSAKGKHWSIDLPALDGHNRFEMVLIKYKWFY